MNNKDREVVKSVILQIDQIVSRLEELESSEREKLDCIPESLQDTNLYESISDSADIISDATSYLEDAVDTLNDIT